MVQIFSMYRFSGQIVDTVDEMRTLTVTNHNKLLVVQEDFTVVVKDLLSDEKTPAFIFSTVDKVSQITHCACGNYVATVEGKQTFEKSDRLTIRIYTNWDVNKDENESTKRKIPSKRLIRPRIAEVVTPSCYKMDEDFLDTIEIPISFTSPTLITTCQKTGKLLVVCGPTMHLFRQIYTRNQNGKSPYFMDFSAVPEVFQVDFFPLGVTIHSNVIAAYSESCVSAFLLKKVDKKTFKISNSNNASESRSRNDRSDEQNTSDRLEANSLKLNDIFKLARENRNDVLSNYLDSASFPVIVSIKGVNDVSTLIEESTFPFKILTKQPNSMHNSERAKDTMVETLSEKELKIVAESLLALRIINTAEDCITRVALQILSHRTTETEEEESCCIGGNKFIGVNLLVTTQLEGYLFHMSANNVEDGLRCVAVFNYTSRVINVIFETCFLHVLTETGIETYNIPTLRSTILFEKPDLAKYSRAISILGMHPFMGIVDFVGSNNLITIFTSASEKRTSKDSSPWTVYSLKMPDLFDVYQEMIEYSNSFKTRDDHTYKILSLESFLILQTAITLRLPIGGEPNEQLALNTHQTNSNELAKIYFKSGNADDIRVGCAVILASEIDPINFINSLKSNKEEVINGIVCLVKLWISNNKSELTEERANWLIKLFTQIDAGVELASFLLANESAIRSHGRNVVAFLRKRFDACPEAADMRLVYGLCVIYSQCCQPDDATTVLKTIICSGENRRKCFLEVVAKYWTYLFDQILTNGKKVVSFSEMASIIIEECPDLMTEICTVLTSIKTNLTPPIIAQMLLIPVPSQLSMLKRRNILHAFLESTLSADARVNWEDPTIQDCLRCLVVAYLTECVKPRKAHDGAEKYSPLFTNKLPDFVDVLPLPQTVNVVPLRRLQEMIWSRKLNDELMKDVLNSPSDPLLKLQLNAMLGSFDFVHQLMKYEFWEVVLPYAQASCGDDSAKWKQFIALLWSKLEALPDETSKDRRTYQALLAETLNRLARTVTPVQLSSMMEPLTLKAKDIYWKYLIKAEQYLYAKDLRAVIVNRVEQLSCSDSTQ